MTPSDLRQREGRLIHLGANPPGPRQIGLSGSRCSGAEMPRRTRRPQATSRVIQIREERRANEAQADAAAQQCIDRILEPPPAAMRHRHNVFRAAAALLGGGPTDLNV
jgi:hypothetical protein